MIIDIKKEFDLSSPNSKKAIFLAKRKLPELICDAVNLEGIDYTIPEVQTLLEGITVGGHKLSDQTITLNQAQAWKYLFHLVENDQFTLSKEAVCAIHKIAGFEEALTWGVFRTGLVTISGATYRPPSADNLDRLWDDLIKNLTKHSHILDRAIVLFLEMARTQFFFDVNKRMGRFMMNGLLLSHGYPVINVPAKRALEFNTLMLEFYENADYDPMIDFMQSCLSIDDLSFMKMV